jgi:hypothetical protein
VAGRHWRHRGAQEKRRGLKNNDPGHGRGVWSESHGLEDTNGGSASCSEFQDAVSPDPHTIRSPAMMTPKHAWLIALVIATVLIACCQSRPAHTQAGPANHGLRLHLAIASTRTGDQDSHRVSLNIINTGPEPITLEARPSPGKSYADWLASSTVFTSHPHLHADSFQIGGGYSEAQSVTLATGASTDAQWTVTGNVFSGFDTCSSLTLPMDGLYLLRAHVAVYTDDKQNIDLWSNEAPCSIGGSLDAPRKCSAKIIAVAADRTVTIGVGAQHGVKLGDRYLALRDQRPHLISDIRRVSLIVTAVGEFSCTAVDEPESYFSGDSGAKPWFPEPGLQVFLQPPKPPLHPSPARPTQKPEWPEKTAPEKTVPESNGQPQ